MAVKYDNSRKDRESLEGFYRGIGQGAPWQLGDEEYLRDPLNALRFRLLLKELGAVSPSRLLDAGCGAGYLARTFAESHPAAYVAALDLAPPSANRRGDAARFVAGDAAALPFGDSSFDCVVCSEALEHLPEPREALREFRRVLAPGGSLLVTVPNLFCLDSIEGKLHIFERAGEVLAQFGVKRAGGGVNTHITKLFPAGWEEMISGEGFEVTYQQPIRIFPYVPYFLKPVKAVENTAAGAGAMLTAQAALDRALRRAPLGQLHFFRCVKA